MAKGQHLSKYQSGIVRRYYDHLDTIALDKLAQSASELYLTTEPKKVEKLWQAVERSLGKLAVSDTQVRTVLTSKDIKGLAQLVSDLSNPARQTKKSVPQRVRAVEDEGLG